MEQHALIEFQTRFIIATLGTLEPVYGSDYARFIGLDWMPVWVEDRFCIG